MRLFVGAEGAFASRPVVGAFRSARPALHWSTLDSPSM
jgi:hypothetical protein